MVLGAKDAQVGRQLPDGQGPAAHLDVGPLQKGIQGKERQVLGNLTYHHEGGQVSQGQGVPNVVEETAQKEVVRSAEAALLREFPRRKRNTSASTREARAGSRSIERRR